MQRLFCVPSLAWYPVRTETPGSPLQDLCASCQVTLHSFLMCGRSPCPWHQVQRAGTIPTTAEGSLVGSPGVCVTSQMMRGEWPSRCSMNFEVCCLLGMPQMDGFLSMEQNGHPVPEGHISSSGPPRFICQGNRGRAGIGTTQRDRRLGDRWNPAMSVMQERPPGNEQNLQTLGILSNF